MVKKHWNNGVPEYWSDGSKKKGFFNFTIFQYSITPLLQ